MRRNEVSELSRVTSLSFSTDSQDLLVQQLGASLLVSSLVVLSFHPFASRLSSSRHLFGLGVLILPLSLLAGGLFFRAAAQSKCRRRLGCCEGVEALDKQLRLCRCALSFVRSKEFFELLKCLKPLGTFQIEFLAKNKP
jgi:hypothetical protein